MKKDGAKNVSITTHNLNFKEGDDDESGFNIAGLETDRPQRLEEGVEVQITLKGSGPINKRSHVHDFKNRADAEKFIKWYKTGGSLYKKNKVDKMKPKLSQFFFINCGKISLGDKKKIFAQQ